MYTIQLDITGGISEDECDPPTVYIINEKNDIVLQVFEEPISKSGKNLWDINDWEPGPFIKQLLELLDKGS